MSERAERQYRTRYHAQWVLPITTPPIADGTVVVEGERIVWVGPRARAPGGGAAREVELGEAFLLPGLVNAHTHLDLTVMRGALDGLSFFAWVRTLTAARREVLGDDDLLDSARLGVLEGLRAGVTTYADTSPLDAAFEAMRQLGARGIAYREVFGPSPASCEASMAELRAAVVAMRARETPLVRVGVSPHAPYSVSDALFTAVAAYAASEALPLATHVAESADETQLITQGAGPFADFLRGRAIDVAPRGRSPVALLERCGVLAPNALLIHCIRADREDIAAIARHGAATAHCPASNAWFGHGTAPLAELLGARVRVGLGTDSLASNEGMNLLREARLAVHAQHERGQAGIGAQAALELATLGGARALGLDAEIGSLEAGKQADLSAFECRPVRGADTGPEDQLLALSGRSRASLAVVAGRERVRAGRLVASEDPALENRVTAAAARLSEWRRSGLAGVS